MILAVAITPEQSCNFTSPIRHALLMRAPLRAQTPLAGSVTQTVEGGIFFGVGNVQQSLLWRTGWTFCSRALTAADLRDALQYCCRNCSGVSHYECIALETPPPEMLKLCFTLRPTWASCAYGWTRIRSLKSFKIRPVEARTRHRRRGLQRRR